MKNENLFKLHVSEICVKQICVIRGVFVLLTLFLPALGGISPLIVYHVTTPNRNRVNLDMTPIWALSTDKAPTYLQPHYGNGVFGNVYLLALGHTKR